MTENEKHHVFTRALLLAIIIPFIFIAGCCCENARDTWGSESKRFKRAACNAVFDLQTIIPLVGGSIFFIGDLDERTSDWAAGHNPVFGSEKAARRASDSLYDALFIEAILTFPLNQKKPLERAAAEGLAYISTGELTDIGKSYSDRTRPDRSDDRSFPSGHSSKSFSLATISNRNLDYEHYLLPDSLRRPLQFANVGAASLTAWARVEGLKHYPSDVLFGAALGHCLTAFVHDYFIDDLPQADRFHFLIRPCEQGTMVQVSFAF